MLYALAISDNDNELNKNTKLQIDQYCYIGNTKPKRIIEIKNLFEKIPDAQVFELEINPDYQIELEKNCG